MEQKLSSTQMIRKNVYEYVLHCNKSLKYPTYVEIRQHMNKVIETAPYLFGEGEVTSTKGTMRSMLSELTQKKEKRRIDNVFFHEINGIQKFFIDPTLVVKKQIENNSKDIVEKENNTIHADCQYMICDIFTNKGFQVFVPKGDRNQKNSFGKTIEEKFSESIFEVEDSVGKFIDVVILKDQKPLFLFEVEESTSVRNGLTRMTTFKGSSKSISSYIVSSKDSYKKKFDKESKWDIFADLKCEFISNEELKSMFENQNNLEVTKKFFNN